MKRTIGKRQHLKVTRVASSSLLPVAEVLADEIGVDRKAFGQVLKADFTLSVVGRNLLNLRFYFINAKKVGGRLQPLDISKKSYLIIRLPQQHVTEESFQEHKKPRFAQARLSGFSYLAFQLWPDSNKQHDKRHLPIALRELLNWNDAKRFKLITLVEWLKLKGGPNGPAFMTLAPPEKLQWPQADDSDDYKTEKVLSARVLLKYGSIVRRLLNQNAPGATAESFVPITLFEVPERLFIAPVATEGDRWWFIPNRMDTDSKPHRVKKSNRWVEVRRFEIWNNALWKKPGPQAEKNSLGFRIETPHFRAVGVRVDGFDGGTDLIPTLQNKEHLAFLTQYAKEHASPGFDIRESNGFFFTGAGIITHLKYFNLDEKPVGIDLIEYEQIINQGRDIFVKFGRLGYNSKTGQRYKIVTEVYRKIAQILGATSYLERKLYCECIDKHITYNDEELPISQFLPLDGKPSCHYRRNQFKELDLIEKDRIPIMAVRGNDILQPDEIDKAQYFWPILDGPRPTTAAEVPLERYFHCEFKAKDHEGRTVNGRTPFMFILASAIETKNVAGAYSDHIKSDGPDSVFDKRRRTYLRQKVAYKDAAEVSTQRPSSNKVNIIETDFIETYFRVRDVPASKKPGALKHVIYPQLEYARVFLDHIRDLTQRKLPSYIQYYEPYVSDGFAGGNKDAKIFLEHTPWFISKSSKSELNVRPERERIETALREAKDKLGNLVTPDIIPDTISESFGITLPPGGGRLVKNGQSSSLPGLDIGQLGLSPKEFLRGKFSEMLGGLDLRELLNELIPETQIPLFEVTKTLDRLTGQLQGSQLYQQIVSGTIIRDPLSPEEKRPAAEIIQKYEKIVALTRATIQNAEAEIREKRARISSILPNADDLRNLVRTLFIQAQTELLNTEHLDEAKLNRFFACESEALWTQVKSRRKELLQLIEEIGTHLGAHIPPALAQEITGLLQKLTQLAQDLEQIAFSDNDPNDPNNMRRRGARILELAGTVPLPLEQINVGGSQIKVFVMKRTQELVRSAIQGKTEPLTFIDNLKDAGYLQLQSQSERLQQIIIRNIGIDGFPRDAAVALQAIWKSYSNEFFARQKELQENHFETLSRSIREAVGKLEGVAEEQRAQLDSNATESVQHINASLQKACGFVDFARRFDPYYYYEERKRIEKDINDVKLRFSEEFLKAFNKNAAQFSELSKPYDEAYIEFVNVAGQYRKTPADALYKLVQEAADKLSDRNRETLDKLNDLARQTIPNLPGYEEVRRLEEEIKNITIKLETTSKQLVDNLNAYKEVVQDRAQKIQQPIEEQVQHFIDEQTAKLEQAADAENVQVIQKAINEAKNIYTLLTTLKRQELSYTWKTTQFRDLNLGIVSFKKFSSPPTELVVDVKSTVHFATGKLPPAVERIESYSENRLRNFALSFFNAITIGFAEVGFVAGTGREMEFSVKIKDVKFDGALAFVQAFEKYLQTLGSGLILTLQPDHVALGYSLPIPSIRSPAMGFFNLTLSFDFRLYFDKRPMRFGFSISRPDSKFVLAAGIYAGFGYFGIVGDPKRGIVEISIALEAGAWAGIRIGPVGGEVKLAFGFSYTKNETGVRLEGYIVAEGRLSLWIVEVAARIYLGIISENSCVEGSCTVSYSVKIGFFKKSFSGTFYKRIAGAETNNQAIAVVKVSAFAKGFTTFTNSKAIAGICPELLRAAAEEAANREPLMETRSVGYRSWKKFVEAF
jgi:hypothetical protein